MALSLRRFARWLAYGATWWRSPRSPDLERARCPPATGSR